MGLVLINDRNIMNNGLENMRKKAVMAYFKVQL
jgi:hypothetical protein